MKSRGMVLMTVLWILAVIAFIAFALAAAVRTEVNAAGNELVDSILDWRDSDDVPRLHGAEVDDYGQVFLSRGRLPYNAPFKSLQEVLLVKHMTPAIYFGHVEFDTAANEYRKVRGLG